MTFLQIVFWSKFVSINLNNMFTPYYAKQALTTLYPDASTIGNAIPFHCNCDNFTSGESPLESQTMVAGKLVRLFYGTVNISYGINGGGVVTLFTERHLDLTTTTTTVVHFILNAEPAAGASDGGMVSFPFSVVSKINDGGSSGNWFAEFSGFLFPISK